MLNLDIIENIIAQVEVGFFLSRQGKRLHGRPLATLQLDGSGSVWFFIKKDTAISKEVLEDDEVYISYNDLYSSNYLLITGRAGISNDKVLRERLWHPDLSRWLGCGSKNPNLELIRVEILEVEFWNPATGKMELQQRETATIIPINNKENRDDEQLGKVGV